MMGRFLIVLLVLLFCCDDADARWFRRRSSTRVYASLPAEYYTASDQRKCEIEAAYMARHGIRAHVGPVIGNFEGWGSGGPGCATCTPGRGMTLTGDAYVGGIRVRSWR